MGSPAQSSHTHTWFVSVSKQCRAVGSWLLWVLVPSHRGFLVRMLGPPHLLLLVSLMSLPCSALHCIQCSSNYEEDCMDPVASQRFLYPCKDNWNTSSCVKTTIDRVVIRNCSKGYMIDGCITTHPDVDKVCSCDSSGCNTGSLLTSPSGGHRIKLGVIVLMLLLRGA